MNNKQNNKNKTALAVATTAGAAGLLGVGALALFSDVSEVATGAQAGTVSVEVVNPHVTNGTNINPGDNDGKMWGPRPKENDREYIPTPEDPLYDPESPQDEDDDDSYVKVATTPHDLSFTIANTGTKSIRTRQTFLISVYQGDNDGNAEYLPADVFTLYEDGTYLGTKTQTILDVTKNPTYGTSINPTNKYADRYQEALAGTIEDAAKIAANFEKTLTDRETQPWEELAYKYFVDVNDVEYLVAAPSMQELPDADNLPTVDDVVEVPEDVVIKAIKYVMYSDIYDGVTNDHDKAAAEVEGSFGELSNLGDAETNKNISVIPDAYHVQSKPGTGGRYEGSVTVYYKDQNGNVQYASADGTEFFFLNKELDSLIAAQDVVVDGVSYKANDYIDVASASAYISANGLFPVELNTEIDEDGAIVFEGGKPVVHAYNAKEYTYMLGMSKEATNKYQGATLTIDIIVEAMQYRNTSGTSDWNTITTNTLTTALDFTGEGDTYTTVTVPAKDAEPEK